MSRFMRKLQGYKNWYNVIGLRYDEPRRVASALKQYEAWTNITPMNDAKHTVEDVSEFWRKQNFDLKLTNANVKLQQVTVTYVFSKAWTQQYQY